MWPVIAAHQSEVSLAAWSSLVGLYLANLRRQARLSFTRFSHTLGKFNIIQGTVRTQARQMFAAMTVDIVSRAETQQT